MLLTVDLWYNERRFETPSMKKISLLLTLSLFYINQAAAQIIPAGGLGSKIQEGRAGLSDFPKLVVHWVEWILSMAGGFAVVMVMWGGIRYMTGSAMGEKEEGKKVIIYALSGLFVCFFAWWFVELIQVWMTT